MDSSLINKKIITLKELQAQNIAIEEKLFLSIGGGIGSFCWVDALKIHGASSSSIVVIGKNKIPYKQFREYCENSCLFDNDRLRSDSGARPDNFWGFPGFGLSEIFDEVKSLHFLSALKIAYQLLCEPIFSDYYTPSSERVFNSIEKEMKRIDWVNVIREGEALFLRKMEDGRFVVFYKIQENVTQAIIANVVHISIGHVVKKPSFEIAADIKDKVAFTYQLDKKFIADIQKNGGNVVVIGRGIAAATIVEKLLKIQSENGASVRILSIFKNKPLELKDKRNMRQENFAGWKLQNFNWPKSAFGGRLKNEFEKSGVEDRKQLSHAWSAASVPKRKKWISLLAFSLKKRTYAICFGTIKSISGYSNQLQIQIDSQSSQKLTLFADYVIDASGFEDTVNNSEFYTDLINEYDLKTLDNGRLSLSSNFEIEELSSDVGKVFVSGAFAAGNSYGPVDSFLGHQYAAITSIQALSDTKWTHIRSLTFIRSFIGWLKWSFNIAI